MPAGMGDAVAHEEVGGSGNTTGWLRPRTPGFPNTLPSTGAEASAAAAAAATGSPRPDGQQQRQAERAGEGRQGRV